MSAVLAEATAVTISMEATAVAGTISLLTIGLIAWLVKELLATQRNQAAEKFTALAEATAKCDKNSEDRHHRLRADLQAFSVQTQNTIADMRVGLEHRMTLLEAHRESTLREPTDPGRRKAS
jgi:hypothetical protein